MTVKVLVSLVGEWLIIMIIIFFKRLYLFIFRERGREGEREGEKHQCVIDS